MSFFCCGSDLWSTSLATVVTCFSLRLECMLPTRTEVQHRVCIWWQEACTRARWIEIFLDEEGEEKKLFGQELSPWRWVIFCRLNAVLWIPYAVVIHLLMKPPILGSLRMARQTSILKDLQLENLSARWCNSLGWDTPTKSMVLFSLKRTQDEVVKSSVNSRHGPFLERSQQISYRGLVDSCKHRTDVFICSRCCWFLQRAQQISYLAWGLVDSCKHKTDFFPCLRCCWFLQT